MNTNTSFSRTPPAYSALQVGAQELSPQFLDAYLCENRAVKEEQQEAPPMEQRLPNGGGGGDDQSQQIYFGGSPDPRMGQRFDRYSQQIMTPGGSMQGQAYTPDPSTARTPEMHNGSPQVAQQQQLTLEQQQQLSAQRAAMMQRQYSSPVLTGRQQLNGADQRSKSSQNLIGGGVQQRPQEAGGQAAAMNGGMATASQMAMNQGGFMSPTYAAAATTHPTPNGQQSVRPPSAQQLAQMQQLQYHQQQQQTSSSQQQLSMSMQINSQMTQMNIQVGGNQTSSQQQQAMMQQQYTPQQLQQMQPGPSQQIHPSQQTVQQHLQQQAQLTNGQYAAYQNQMQMTQSGMMPQGHMQMTEQQLQLEQQARLQQQLRQRQHPHLSTQPRSASMGSLPLGQQQPPQYPYGQQQAQGGPRPNGMNPFTIHGTPVTSNWTMAYQTEMPPAFLSYYHPGRPHPYFDHTRRNLQYPYPMGVKDIGDRPGEPLTFGYLPDSIYYNSANDRRGGGKGCGNDASNLPGPSTSKASPKKRGAGTAGGGAGAKKQRRTNSDATDDNARFVQPYPPNPTTQQQRMPSTSTGMFATTGQAFEGFSQPMQQQQQSQLMMQQQPPLQRQMSAPAYSGLAQSAQDAMQSARQQQALANAQAQYAAQQQQQPTTPSQITLDGYQHQSANGEGMYSEMQWRGAYTQQPSTSTAPSTQPVFRSPQSTPQAFNNGSQQPQQGQQPGSNDQMYWNQQQ